MSTSDDVSLVDALFGERRFLDALPHVRRRAESAPNDWRRQADLTVALKHARDFAGVRTAGLRALELGAPLSDPGLHWNLGIAATALGDWALARRAWSAQGISLLPGEGRIDGDFGVGAVRITPDAAPEVVWVRRLCPARAIIHSIPLPETGRRYGDVVLHDGEPRGRRRVRDGTVPVFDELALLERSRFDTIVLEIDAPTPADVHALRVTLGETCTELEDWTASLVVHCAACSEGLVEHEHPVDSVWRPARRLAVATAGGVTDELLDAWAFCGESRRVRAVYVEPAP